MKIMNTTTLAALVATAGLSFGCALPPTPVEAHWGEAVTGGALAQTVDPEAGNRVEGPEGLDPVTGELVAETYKKNQRNEKKDPRKIFLISQ